MTKERPRRGASKLAGRRKSVFAEHAVQEIIRSALDCIIGMDQQGRIIEFNPAAEKVFGYARVEALGKPLVELIIPPSLRERHRQGLARYLSSGESKILNRRIEITAMRSDGTEFPVELTVVHHGDRGGSAFVGYVRDITERNLTQMRLAQSEVRLRTIIESEPECVKLVASDGRIIEMNPAGLAMIEADSLEQVAGKLIYPLIAPQYRPAFQALLEANFRGETGMLELEILGCKGTRRWLETHGAPLRDENGRIYAMLGITRDITDRKRAEEQTLRNLERIRALHEIEVAITSTLELQARLDILLQKIDLFLPIAAATTVRLLNRDTGELLSLACLGLDAEEWRSQERRTLSGRAKSVVETKTPLAVRNLLTDPRTYNREIYRKRCLVSYLGVPLIVKDDVLGVLAIYTNEEHEFSKEEIEFLNTLAGQVSIAIHDAQLFEQTRKQAADLEQANRVKDEFLSVISHELRTPLNVVVGYAGMMRDGAFGEINSKQVQALSRIDACSKDLLGMINSILYATSLEARAVAVERYEVSTESLLDELKSDYGVLLNEEINIVWDYTSDLPAIKTDGGKLKQILQNLINNALKFTESGSVTIAARYFRETNAITFKVADTGVGIPIEKIPLIFDKFHQLDSSETRVYGGVGIGLYVAKRFAELLSGKIEVESELGKGSTFTLTIPLEGQIQEATANAAPFQKNEDTSV